MQTTFTLTTASFLVTVAVTVVFSTKAAGAFSPVVRPSSRRSQSWTSRCVVAAVVASTQRFASASSSIRSSSSSSDDNAVTTSTASSNDATKTENGGDNVLQSFVQQEFPAFYALLSVNDGLWTTLANEVSSGMTLFAPSNAAFDALGERKLQQLKDVRNQETIVKMGLYHIVLTDAVSAARLRTEDWTIPAPKDGSPRPITVQGLVTLGGQVPVARCNNRMANRGGTFWSALLGKSAPSKDGAADGDAGVVIGPSARIVKSYKLNGGSIIVHEVDSLISPDLLWRYCDQLRIPGF